MHDEIVTRCKRWASESIDSMSHWGLTECVSAQRTSARDLLFGAGQAQGQKCASPFRLSSRNDNPWMVRPRIREESRLAREQREQQQLEKCREQRETERGRRLSGNAEKWR